MYRASLILVLTVIAGCQDVRSSRGGDVPPSIPSAQTPRGESNQPSEDVAEASSSSEPGAVSPSDETRDRKVMAYVNGAPIYMDALHDLLVRAYGLRTALHLVGCELIEQAAAERDLTVTEQELQMQHDAALRQMFPNVPESIQRQRLLEQLMLRQNIPEKQWRMSIRRNVLLGKLVAPAIKVTEREVRRAYEDTYGRKIVIRHIQSENLGEAQKAQEALRNGADFAELASKVSKNASAAKGGLLPPVGPNPGTLPRALHKVAWDMKEPGQISDPVQAGTSYHILYLEKVIEPQDVKFNDVGRQLASEVRDRKIRSAANRLLQEMIDKAEIKWVDPVLGRRAPTAVRGLREGAP